MTAVHHPEPIWDEHWQGYELAADDTHRYLWLWHGDDLGYDHGWCYPRNPDAVTAAVAAWDPETQDEPAGWHKRPTAPVRRAPRRDEARDYNRARCLHGCYLHLGCRTIGCPEVLNRPIGSPA